MIAGLLIGSTTSIGDGYGLAAIWTPIIGFSMGFTLPTAMSAASEAIPDDRSGMASGSVVPARPPGPSNIAIPPAAIGLRERKKARTRAVIRTEAIRLFAGQGFASTTVEQIAEAADVSPSTLFRTSATEWQT